MSEVNYVIKITAKGKFLIGNSTLTEPEHPDANLVIKITGMGRNDNPIQENFNEFFHHVQFFTEVHWLALRE